LGFFYLTITKNHVDLGKSLNMEINLELLARALSKEPVLIFIGQSGCGKQTQSEALTSVSKLLHPDKEVYVAESGKLYREGIPLMTDFNKRLLSEIQTAGKLQSWITTTALWAYKFLNEYQGGLTIVDGSPRTVEEAKAMVDFYYQFARKEIIVFIINITDEEADKRMISRNEALVASGGKARSDTDTPEKRKAKIAYFHTDVMPALHYFNDIEGVVVNTVNGMEPPEIVTKRILSLLVNYHSK
jgi:adenylate kinase family enzyme